SIAADRSGTSTPASSNSAQHSLPSCALGVAPAGASVASEVRSSGASALEFDLVGGLVTDQRGVVVADVTEALTSGESIQYVQLVDGDTALITALAAPALDTSSMRLQEEAVDPEKLQAAKEYDGIVPAELVATEFTESGEDLVTSGVTPTESIDTESMRISSISAVTSSAFAIAWDSDAAKHIVYRDGAQVASLSRPYFADAGLAGGSVHEYQIDSIQDDGLVTSKTLPVTTTSNGFGARDATLLTTQTYNSQAIYRTFIPDSRVFMDFWTTWGCGQQGTSNRSFGGDDRGFKTPPYNAPWDDTSSRTAVFLNINWDNPSPYDVVWVKEVGTTHLYEGSTLIEERTASDAGIKIEEAGSTTAYAQARVNHDVANPFCSAGSIKYNVMFRWYRNGTFEVVGWRQPAPAHEIYGGWDTGTGMINWHQFGRYDNEGFGCLAGGCANRTINVTKSY
ncbi:hypothetical protein, partial [Microbacterium lacticum]